MRTVSYGYRIAQMFCFYKSVSTGKLPYLFLTAPVQSTWGMNIACGGSKPPPYDEVRSTCPKTWRSDPVLGPTGRLCTGDAAMIDVEGVNIACGGSKPSPYDEVPSTAPRPGGVVKPRNAAARAGEHHSVLQHLRLLKLAGLYCAIPRGHDVRPRSFKQVES